ncbi:ankyrin repeat domain-containing protein SOWAHB isoform X3 [Drosophila novamexicana]|uniref:ankyrin repeat domain-containing protein SOWAHB isoform X3 n=1 Tax=Drosophila novamexicana TaxID=47314 RepID=UPI0011E5A7A8|nr:ankyrin repeat domain-containing protein SOWAHB isoform X3 [Drosophila novamexicana]
MSANDTTKQLSIVDIRNYMLQNDGKVTNHALVKHFKKYLTHTQNEAEARKRFKTYVTLLSTIKNENNQKYLILRKKYINECPSEEVVERAVEAAGNASTPSSPGAGSLVSVTDSGISPLRQPPPYKAPPEVQQSPVAAPPAPMPAAIVSSGVVVHPGQVESYRDCVNEFTAAMQRIDPARLQLQSSAKPDVDTNNELDTVAVAGAKSVSRANSVDETGNKENIPRFSFSSGASTDSSATDKVSGTEAGDAAENPISVKEATRKFNRMASEEEAKIISPPPKKKPEKQLIEEKDSPDVTLAHPKAKEWIVSMAKANYQELAKLANDYPELVKLQCPATGYTALHWAAKHGNEDVVKLIAGTYKADVNAKTHGGYTPLHLATQFGRQNIYELLWNVYKANRDIMDWSGNKPLDYSRQRPSVSASTCSIELMARLPLH